MRIRQLVDAFGTNHPQMSRGNVARQQSPRAHRAVAVLLCCVVLASSQTSFATDTTPPSLTELSFTPAVIDTTSGSATITVTGRILDSESGVSPAPYLWFVTDAANQGASASLSRISGTANDGVYRGTATFPRYSAAGAWRADYFNIQDAAGNDRQYGTADLTALGFATDVDNRATVEDATAPNPTEFSLSPTTIDTTGIGATVTVTTRLLDERSGVDGADLRIRNTTTNQEVIVYLGRISGTANDGVYRGITTFPRYSAAGSWHVVNFLTADLLGNRRRYSTDELAALGFTVDLDNHATVEDVTAPNPTEFSLAPAVIDTSAGAATVTVTTRVLDAQVGTSQNPYLYFQNTTTDATVFASLGRISGTASDGVYQGVATFPQFSAAGVWRVAFLTTRDNLGNSHQYSAAELAALGFATDVDNQAATRDTTAPSVTELSITPAVVDTTSAADAVTVTARVQDAQSGSSDVYMYFRSATTNQSFYGNLSRISGTASDGVYRASFTFPRYSAIGVWRIDNFTTRDALQNSHEYRTADLAALTLPTDVDNRATMEDVSSPELREFSFTPAVIDTSARAASVTVTARLVDAPVGVRDRPFFYFRSSTSDQGGYGYLSRISGTTNDGVYQGTVTFPQFSAAGVWNAYYLAFKDALGNSHEYGTTDLAGLGFVTDLDNQASVEDVAAPNPTELSISPMTIDTATASAVVIVTIRVLDVGAGLSSFPYGPPYLYFRHVTTNATLGAWASRISGTQNDGVYRATFLFPQTSARGLWQLDEFTVSDVLGNNHGYGTSDLAALGLPTDLQNGAAACGNTSIDTGETCDDGNLTSGDGCHDCQIEPCYTCSGGICSPSTAGTGCSDDGDRCTDDVCDGAGTCAHPGVVCDDGNPCNGVETCDSSIGCQAGTALVCDDSNVCNGIESCDPVSGCTRGIALDCDDADGCTNDSCDATTACAHVEAPATTCLDAGKAQFALKISTDEDRDRLKWEWGNGPAVEQANLGAPDTATAYTLCIYDSTANTDSLVGKLEIDPNAGWLSKDPRGWSYEDTTGAFDGITRAQLRTGLAGESKASVSARGALIPMPVPFSETEMFDVDSHLTVQFVNDSTSLCWTSKFVAATKNTATRFQARTP